MDFGVILVAAFFMGFGTGFVLAYAWKTHQQKSKPTEKKASVMAQRARDRADQAAQMTDCR